MSAFTTKNIAQLQLQTRASRREGVSPARPHRVRIGSAAAGSPQQHLRGRCRKKSSSPTMLPGP